MITKEGGPILDIPKRIYSELNMPNLKHNILEIRKIINKNTLIMGVVKADAYGHGAIEVSKVLTENGVDRLAVATIDEAIILRESGINVPILVLGYIHKEDASKILHYDLMPIIPNIAQAELFSSLGVQYGKSINAHIKIDTGMGRLGFFPNIDGINQIVKVASLPKIELEGIMTHLSSADSESEEYSSYQFKLFNDICKTLKEKNIDFKIRHVANSAVTLKYKEMHLDMIRPGLLIYGIYPKTTKENSTINLKPIMTLKSKLTYIKEFPPNYPISYNRTYKTSRQSVIGVVSTGYADGYGRELSNKGYVLINGEVAPIVGQICMDYFMVDITDIYKDVYEGQEVTLLGKDKEKEITVDILGDLCKTISYEIVCRINKRVERIYIY